jgi:hypothetical protein
MSDKDDLAQAAKYLIAALCAPCGVTGRKKALGV